MKRCLTLALRFYLVALGKMSGTASVWWERWERWTNLNQPGLGGVPSPRDRAWRTS